MNNGVATRLFSIGRGVRQGEPLSPNLFILALKTLLTAIKQNEDSSKSKIVYNSSSKMHRLHG